MTEEGQKKKSGRPADHERDPSTLSRYSIFIRDAAEKEAGKLEKQTPLRSAKSEISIKNNKQGPLYSANKKKYDPTPPPSYQPSPFRNVWQLLNFLLTSPP
ncbi:hypothetical protein QE152_g17008 [Popillia japonica]|uniref:Uncharacterized protein n=1 Tax=Popillia japonica TaxID=7064 RepID=A0AAW1L6E3_POPJA